MNSEKDLLHQPHPIQPKPPSSFKSLKPLILLTAVIVIAIVAGVSGYVLGMKNRQSIPTLQAWPSPTPISSFPLLPTIEDESPATIHWKTYVNARWGLSFKHPETWFPQEAPQLSHQGDAVNFFPYGVTPYLGEADDGTNAVLVVVNRDGYSESTNEQFINEARQTDGKRVLNVAGKPALRGDGYRGEWYYEIKLSSTRELLFTPFNEEASNRLDTIISTIKFTNE